MSAYDGSSTSTAVIADEKTLSPAELWETEITYAEKELEKFHKRADTVNRRYLDERDAMDSDKKWFNLFYANTKILKAALYSQIPEPEVCRKYHDYNDDVARVAATILQRAISPDPDDPRDLFDSTMRHCMLDRLVPGLAQAWLRLETDTEDVELILESAPSVGEFQSGPTHHDAPLNSGFKTGPAPDTPVVPPTAKKRGKTQEPATMTFKRITDQRVVVDYVYWKDFLWSPCRIWDERRWIARKVYMGREALRERFGEELGNEIPLNHRPTPSATGLQTPAHMAIQRACIYEIWDRVHRKVIWYSKDMQQVLETKDDFLNLVGFEPCPKPMLANITTSNTVPRPDYYLVQDQYNELDTVNNRISLLVRACKVAGVYDKASEGVQRLLQEGFENQLIPVDNWAMFAEKGGVKGQLDWLPLDQIVLALQRLYESREMTKAQIYELTGISDIVRGASKASETLGAQEIKAKFASVRIKDTQDEAALFASEILRLKAEIMVKHFDPEILRRKSNIMRTDDAQLADIALELLQSEEGFEWRITVTSDQMAQADYAMEKQDRVELLTSVASFLQMAGALFLQNPKTGPLLVGLLKYAVAGYKGARDIETLLDRELDNMIRQPAQEKPDPEAQKAQLEMAKGKQQMQLAAQKGQLDAQKGQQQVRLGQQKLVQQAQKGNLELKQAQAKGMFELQHMVEKAAVAEATTPKEKKED